MPRPPLTVTIITCNEEKNLPRAIRSVRWAEEVLVVDSGSSDGTVEVARREGARVLQNPWPGHGAQKNFAQKNASHDWILSLDADEEVSPELARDIQAALESVSAARSVAKGFFFPRKTWFLGRWILHGGWYPNHLVRLADRRFACWTEPRIHEQLEVQGEVSGLAGPLYHYSFSGIGDQVRTNVEYARLGAQDLRRKGQRPSVALLVLKPIGKFVETYLLKRGFLDGLAGLIIAVNAAHSMFLKHAYLLEEELAGDCE